LLRVLVSLWLIFRQPLTGRKATTHIIQCQAYPPCSVAERPHSLHTTAPCAVPSTMLPTPPSASLRACFGRGLRRACPGAGNTPRAASALPGIRSLAQAESVPRGGFALTRPLGGESWTRRERADSPRASGLAASERTRRERADRAMQLCYNPMYSAHDRDPCSPTTGFANANTS